MTDNFLPGGFYFVYRDQLGGNCCVHTEVANPDPHEWLAWDGGEFQPVDRAGETWEIPDGAGGWQPNLPFLRGLRWAEAKSVRDGKAAGGCATPLGRVQTDQASCLKITGAVTGAMVSQQFGQPFSIDWTMEDNSVVAHDGAAMIAMGMAVLTYLSACQAAGTAIRDAINAASDEAAIAAVDIEAGYPED